MREAGAGDMNVLSARETTLNVGGRRGLRSGPDGHVRDNLLSACSYQALYLVLGQRPPLSHGQVFLSVIFQMRKQAQRGEATLPKATQLVPGRT